MNERIKELAEQAGFSSGAMINIGTGEAEELWIRYNENEDREEFPNSKMMQKFAELIVQECADILRQEGELAKIQALAGPYPVYKLAAMNEAANRIKQHFGVKS